MAGALRTLVAVDSGLDTHELANTVTSDADINVVGVINGMEETWRALQDSSCDVLVVACEGYSERVLALIDSSVKQNPQRPVLVLGYASPNGFVRRTFEAGADDFLMLPQSPDQVRFSILKLVARKNRKADGTPGHQGRLVCVLGPKGGSGKTLVSVNLGVALAEAGQRVAIVDLDLQFGDVALCLGLAPERTAHDLALAGGTLDAQKLDAYLMAHSSGLRVLLAPTRPDQASAISTELIRDMYASLRTTFDVVIVDTPPGFTPEVIATIDAATDLVMVGMLDSLSLKNTKLGLETLELMGCEPDIVTARPQPGPEPGRHHPRRRRERPRAQPRHLYPQRPRDPSSRQRRRTDHTCQAGIRGRCRIPATCIALRSRAMRPRPLHRTIDRAPQQAVGASSGGRTDGAPRATHTSRRPTPQGAREPFAELKTQSISPSSATSARSSST